MQKTITKLQKNRAVFAVLLRIPINFKLSKILRSAGGTMRQWRMSVPTNTTVENVAPYKGQDYL